MHVYIPNQALFEEILERASAMDTLAYSRFNPDNHRDFDLDAVVSQVTEPVKYIDRAGKERLEREREEREADRAEVQTGHAPSDDCHASLALRVAATQPRSAAAALTTALLPARITSALATSTLASTLTPKPATFVHAAPPSPFPSAREPAQWQRGEQVKSQRTS